MPVRLSWALPALLLIAAPSDAALQPAAGISAEAGFVENRGQLHGRARFYVQGAGSAVYFEPAAVVLDRPPAGPGTAGAVVRVDFPSSTRPATPVASEPLRSTSHFYGGNRPERWRSSVPTFAEVRYPEVGPGIDLVYRVAEGRLKYDLVLAPGADPAHAQLRYQGAERLIIDREGALEIHTAAGTLREERPCLYQDIDGRRVEVRGGYRLVSPHVLGFWATGYDSGRPLIVDPGITWSSFLGGSSNDYPFRVALASNGDVVIAGYTESDDYPVSSGAYQRVKGLGRDVVVTRMRADGAGIVWSTFLGGAGMDHGLALAVDGSNNVFVGGNTLSTDFPVSAGAFRTSYGGGGDGFVTKLNANGGLVYSTYVGGVASDIVNAIAVDASGSATVAGTTSSINYPTTPGVVRGTLDSEDGFVTRLNAAGTQLVYSTLIGCPGNDQLLGLALDGQGQATVVGRTNSREFPVTAGVVDPTSDAYWDGVVVRLNATATAFLYSTYLSGAGYDEPQGVVMDGSGNAFVVGQTASPNFPVSSNAFQRAKAGGTYDGFITKLSPDARTLLYSTFLGGAGDEYLYGIAIDAGGEAVVVGYGSSTNFPVTTGAFDASANGGSDGVIARLSATGGSLAYGSYLGGAGLDCARAVVLRANGEAVVVGYTASTTFPTTAGSHDQNLAGGGAYYDGFVSVLATGGSGGVAVDDERPARPGMMPARPNPFHEQTTFGVTLAIPARVAVRVLDLRGRRVRDLGERRLPAGEHRWTWNGLDERGNDVGAGVYFIEAITPAGRVIQRVVRLQ